MRSWLICLSIICLMAPSTGCRSLTAPSLGGKKSGKKSSLLGVGRRNDRVDQDEVLDPLGRRDTNRLLLDDLAPSQFATTWKTRLTGGVDEQKARQYYGEAKQAFAKAVSVLDADPNGQAHQAYFAEAANKYRLAGASFPNSSLEEDATFFEGESFFFADRYVQANRAFEKLVSNYSGTQHLDKAEERRYAIAVYWLKMSEKTSSPSLLDAKRPKMNLAGEARRVLHRIRIDDPTGRLADDATLALGKAFMQAERYYEAADTFEDLRRNYPGSEHQFNAHMLELQARLSGYQGKSYDDTPLRKADELMKQIVRQFPRESEGQLEYLEEQASMIQKQIAERDYSMGQYFEGRGENLAAKIYYEKVAEQFKNTELAKTVEMQIADVAKKPPKPEQHAKWLINMFPDPEAEKPAIIAGNNESIFR